MQAILDSQNVIEQKNLLLTPIFRDIKTQIRHMTYTPEYLVMREFMDNRNKMLEITEGTMPKEKRDAILGSLTHKYAKLLALKQKEMNESWKGRVNVLEQRLEDMFKLLTLWQKYVDVIYMPETEINLLNQIKPEDIYPEEDTFLQQQEHQELSERVQSLFGKPAEQDSEAAEKKELPKKHEPDAYKTVEEAPTSDTSAESENEFNQTKAAQDKSSESDGFQVTSSESSEDEVAQEE